jgi:hypothetical protein
MSVIQRLTSVGANATVENVIAGSTFEFARTNQLVSIAAVAAATGLFVTINNGTDIVAEEFEPRIRTTFPLLNEDFYYQDVSTPGDRLVIRVRNSTGAPVILRTIVQVTGI